MLDHEPAEPLAFERIVFFSDAVFAIAITLLVLEIKVPHIAHTADAATTLSALGLLIPKAVGYVVSFVVLGSFWIEHHRVFRYITRFDAKLLWWNLAMLLVVAFMPFPTALFSENYTNPVALAVYAFALTGLGLAKIGLWRHAAAGHRLLATEVPPALVRNINFRSWAVPVVSFVVFVGAILGWGLAYIGFAFIPLAAWLLGKGATRG